MTRICLPRNSNFAMAHDATTPKTTFTGTERPATRSVNLTAAQALGSASAAQYAVQPFRNASWNSAASGTKRKSARNARAAASRPRRTQGDPPSRVSCGGTC